MEINLPKGGKPEIEERKLRSEVNWQGRHSANA
jgi:hypothetical protein